MTHITLGTKQEHQGIHIVLSVAPQEIAPDTAGKEVGDIRFNPSSQIGSIACYSIRFPARCNPSGLRPWRHLCFRRRGRAAKKAWPQTRSCRIIGRRIGSSRFESVSVVKLVVEKIQARADSG